MKFQRWLFVLLAAIPGGNHAVSATGNGSLKVAQAYLVKPDVLALRIDAGEMQLAKQVPYQSQPGDQMQNPRPLGDDWVSRGGQSLGGLVGKDRKRLQPFDRVTGTRLNTGWADRTSSYQISATADPTARITPKSVWRKSKPTNMGRTGQWVFDFPMAHVMYLQLPQALKPGQSYTISFPGGNVDPVFFKYQPNVTRSEAVQVSHLGFRPDDPVKLAFLSTWMGNGGKLTYPTGMKFAVINNATNTAVLQGKTKLSRPMGQPEDPRGRDYTLTDVHSMDFSGLRSLGQYRVCVEQIGCSFPFEISANVWQKAFYTSVRGLYHQRSGIELKAPYTNFKRPRSFHPADGTVVYEANVPITDTDQSLGKEEFVKALARTKTQKVVPNAWGGYYDAGDWDRRIQHTDVSRLLLELAELFPQHFERVNLNLPESGDGLPDLVNEALWNVDFFMRIQQPDGGVRGGIQSAIDPRYGEASWQESAPIYAYAPDAWSSYLHAGVAARAANLLKTRDSQRSQRYQTSALKAMAYAEREWAKAGSLGWQWRDARNLAAVELLRLTGDAKWHQIFLQTTVYQDPNQDTNLWDKHDQRDAAFIYVRLPQNLTDARVRQNARNAMLREADSLVNLTNSTAFRWSKEHPYAPVGWGNGLGSPRGVAILRAHQLSRNPKYIRASVLATQFSLGANPENMTYTTGMGHRSPKHPLVIDQRISGQAPPPGITIYGPFDSAQFSDVWTVKLYENVMFPPPKAWPSVESYADIFFSPMAAEFTVMQTIAQATYVWGYLAARPPL
jgi:endoglucanase